MRIGLGLGLGGMMMASFTGIRCMLRKVKEKGYGERVLRKGVAKVCCEGVL